jgi:hypothetical protein
MTLWTSVDVSPPEWPNRGVRRRELMAFLGWLVTGRLSTQRRPEGETAVTRALQSASDSAQPEVAQPPTWRGDQS